MGDGFALTVVSILFAAFGILLGFHAGEEWGARCEGTAGYAVANLAAVLIGSVLFMVVWATGYVVGEVTRIELVVVGMLAIGAVAGAIAGLKFGYGDSVGPWKFVDRLMTPAARARDRERARARRAERKARRGGAEEPELMSVSRGDAEGPHGGDASARGRKGTK